jgi:integrase
VYLIVRRLGAEALPKRSRKKVSPHRIRHTAITAAVRNAREIGLAREEVKKFSRHTDLRMLDRYIDADSQAQAKLARSIGERLN